MPIALKIALDPRLAAMFRCQLPQSLFQASPHTSKQLPYFSIFNFKSLKALSLWT